MTKVILISGKAESGKTASANILKAYLTGAGYRTTIFPMASFVKMIAKTCYGWDGGKGEEGRSLLQRIGTELARNESGGPWCKMLIESIKVIGEDFDYVIVDDIRYPDEIKELVDSKEIDVVLTFRINRPYHIDSLTPEQRNHISETALDNYIFAYNNIEARNIGELARELLIDIGVYMGVGRDGKAPEIMLKLDELLSRGFNYVARDPSGNLYAYESPPIKTELCWSAVNDTSLTRLFREYLPTELVRHDDVEPFNIKEFLKRNGDRDGV